MVLNTMQKVKITIVVTLVTLTGLNPLFASVKGHRKQEKTKPQKTTENVERKQSFFNNLLEDERRIWTSPLRMKSKDLLIWGSVVAGTVFLIANDESIYRRIKDYQDEHNWVNRVSPHITRLGDGEITLSIAGLFYLGGLAFKNEKAKETGLLGIQAIIHTGFVVQVLKHIFGRQRPCVEDGKDHWSGPSGFFKRYEAGRSSRYDAFPSGHTIVAWGTLTVIAEQYKKTIVVPVVCYSLATMAGLSRITEDKHWFSDVFIGAALGYSIGKYLVKARSRHFHVSSNIDKDKTSLTLMYKF